MDEVAYLDHLTLDVVDRPPGRLGDPRRTVRPERPAADRRAHRLAKTIEPVRATDLAGRDVTEILRLGSPDRRPLPQRRRLDRLRRGARRSSSTSATGSAGSGPTDRLVLCLAGWVEYPYSQTNYAAATAGVALQPPVDRAPARRRDLGDDRAPRRLSRRPAPADDARPDRQAHRPALRPPDHDQHGMLLRPGLHRRARSRRPRRRSE